MKTLDDFIRSWDNATTPVKWILLKAPGGIIASVQVDDFILQTDSNGKEVIEFTSKGRRKARLYLELIEGIEGESEE